MKITEYPLPHAESRARSLVITRDNDVWYTDYVRGYVGRFNTEAGKFQEWPSPSGAGSHPDAITSAGKIIWYCETGPKPNVLVRFDSETQKFQSWPIKEGLGIKHLYVQPDGSLWFASPQMNSIGHITINNQGK